MKSGSFKELLVWQRSRRLAVEVYQTTKLFPKEELYGLVQQVRRAAVSVPSNIAEGHRRGTPKEFTQFLKIARGSLGEAETQLILATDLEFIAQDKSIFLQNEIEEIGKMLNGLIRSLDR